MARKETNFKQTDIGLIPHDWEVKEITDIASISTGGQNTQDAEDGGVYPFYVRSPKVERINSYLYDTEGVVTAGDGVGVGKVFHYVNGKFGLHQRCYLIHRFEGVWAKYFYMYFSLQFYNRVMSMTAKSSVDSVRRDMIAHMLIPVPPIEEQKRIAEVLSHFDEHIDNLAALLEKRKQVKAATMQALLSGTTRLPGFTAPWQDIALGKLCLSMNSGGTPDSKNPNFYGGDIPFLSIADMTLQGKYVSKTSKTITKEGLDNSSARLVSRGVLLYAMYASLGKCSLSCIDLSISQAILAIETNPNLLSTNYLYYYLTYIEEAVKTLGQTGTQTNLSKQLVKEICVTAPTSVKEQEAIASILSNMDRGIEALEQEIKKYRQMKEGAMEELLTGKVRLI